MPSRREKLIAAFKVFDADNSGSLSVDEFKKVLQRDKGSHLEMTDEDVKELLETFDENEDGTLSVDEFCEAMVSMSMAEELVAKGFRPDYTHADPSVTRAFPFPSSPSMQADATYPLHHAARAGIYSNHKKRIAHSYAKPSPLADSVV